MGEDLIGSYQNAPFWAGLLLLSLLIIRDLIRSRREGDPSSGRQTIGERVASLETSRDSAREEAAELRGRVQSLEKMVATLAASGNSGT